MYRQIAEIDPLLCSTVVRDYLRVKRCLRQGRLEVGSERCIRVQGSLLSVGRQYSDRQLVLIAVFLVRSSFAVVFPKRVSDYRDPSFTVFEVKRLCS
jgi:hypothetical protein